MKKLAILFFCAIALSISSSAFAQCMITVCVNDSAGAGCDDLVWWEGLTVRVVCPGPSGIDTTFVVNCDSVLVLPDFCVTTYGLDFWAEDPSCSPKKVTDSKHLTWSEIEAACSGGSMTVNLCLVAADIMCD